MSLSLCPKSEKVRKDVFQKVTDGVIAALEEGKIAWRFVWKNGGQTPQFPTSLSTGKAYRGWNVFALWLRQAFDGYTSHLWGTYNQIKARGGQVMKKPDDWGDRDWGAKVIYWSPMIICGGKGKENSEGCGKFYPKTRAPIGTHQCPKCKKKYAAKDDKEILTVKEYTVFNTEQAIWEEGKNPFNPEAVEEKVEPFTDQEIVDEAHEIVMPYVEVEGVQLKHGGNAAYYSPTQDLIQMPEIKDFESGAFYASVLYHETIHSTGHENRLKREGVTKPHSMHSDSYSYEELVAEMGTMMLCALAGHENADTIKNSHAYCQGWVKSFKEKPKMLIQAAASAQKAVDMILEASEVEA